MSTFEILTPAGEANDLHRQALEQNISKSLEIMNKFQNINSEYDAVVKANNDMLKGSGEAKESMFSSWDNFFKKIGDFLTGNNTEYQNVYDKLKEEKQKQEHGVKQEQKREQKKYPELKLKRPEEFGLHDRKSSFFKKMDADIKRDLAIRKLDRAPLSFHSDDFMPYDPLETSTPTEKIRERINESSERIKKLNREINEIRREGIKQSGLTRSAGFYESQAKWATEHYNFAHKMMKEAEGSGRDPKFWQGSADRALREMEYYTPKAIQAKAELDASKI